VSLRLLRLGRTRAQLLRRLEVHVRQFLDVQTAALLGDLAEGRGKVLVVHHCFGEVQRDVVLAGREGE